MSDVFLWPRVQKRRINPIVPGSSYGVDVDIGQQSDVPGLIERLPNIKIHHHRMSLWSIFVNSPNPKEKQQNFSEGEAAKETEVPLGEVTTHSAGITFEDSPDYRGWLELTFSPGGVSTDTESIFADETHCNLPRLSSRDLGAGTLWSGQPFQHLLRLKQCPTVDLLEPSLFVQPIRRPLAVCSPKTPLEVVLDSAEGSEGGYSSSPQVSPQESLLSESPENLPSLFMSAFDSIDAFQIIGGRPQLSEDNAVKAVDRESSEGKLPDIPKRLSVPGADPPPESLPESPELPPEAASMPEGVSGEVSDGCRSDTERRELISKLLGDTDAVKTTKSYRKWESMVENRDIETFMLHHQLTFMRRLRRGIPQHFRWTVWKVVVAWQEVRAENRDYNELHKKPNQWSDLIRIDVPRTFPEIKAFDRTAEQSLYRILNAFANMDTRVGYCQGMNFIGAMVLLVSGLNPEEEETAYWVFASLMEHYDLRGFYAERFPLLRRYVKAFGEMAKSSIPEIYDHFDREGIQPPVYLHQWYFTLFVTSLPLQTVAVIWDCILCEGLSGLLPLSIAILTIVQGFVLRLRFEAIVKFLRSLKKSEGEDEYKIGRMIVRQSDRVKIPPHLAQYLSPTMEQLAMEAATEEEIQKEQKVKERAAHIQPDADSTRQITSAFSRILRKSQPDAD